ncbi:acetylxylan esterase [soil metagenome]
MKIPLCFFLLFCALGAVAETPTTPAPCTVVVDPGYEVGPPSLTIACKDTTATPAIEVTDLITGEVVPVHDSGSGKVQLPASETTSRFLSTTVTLGGEELLKWNTLVLAKGAPLKDYAGQQPYTPPADFDAYWERAKAELDAVPPNAKMEEVVEKGTAKSRLYKVTLDTIRETKIVCWYTVPVGAFDESGAAAKKWPAAIIMPGYGAEEPPLDRTKDGMITLSVNPRNHGPSKEYWKSPVEHLAYNIEDPENFYYKLAYMDCLQASRWLMTRNEIDATKVCAEGGSQGGAFAIALGALEPRIACVVSNLTAFSDYADGMILAQKGFHRQYADLLAGEKTPEARALMGKSMSYTDGVNMARLVHAPTQINVGGIDPVVPYVCGIVVLNHLPADTKKEIHITATAKHEVPGTVREANMRWMKEWMKF